MAPGQAAHSSRPRLGLAQPQQAPTALGTRYAHGKQPCSPPNPPTPPPAATHQEYAAMKQQIQTRMPAAAPLGSVAVSYRLNMTASSTAVATWRGRRERR